LRHPLPKLWEMENMSIHSEKAVALFKQGYNCAQSVFAAFSDVTGLPEQTALKVSASFGGGVAHMREVCGAVSGMCMVTGMLYGFDDPKNPSAKTEHYKLVQHLIEQFREKNDSIVCRELLGLAPEFRTPEPLTEEQKKKAPHSCLNLIIGAAEILDGFLARQKMQIPAES
jgi:C_GCAxxG_C_C family probable redox protein